MKGTEDMLTESYTEEWRHWHDARVDGLNAPYGWLSLISQDWLEDNVPQRIDGIPGTWLLRDGEVSYLPDPQGEAVFIDKQIATQPTHIPLGYNPNCGFGSSVEISYRDLEIELIARSTDGDRRIVGVRVRDPQQALLRHIDDIPTYPLSERWIVPMRFREDEAQLFPAQTVEQHVYETIYHFGQIETSMEGQDFIFDVNGKKRPDGYETIVHLRDASNGKTTYGAGRFVMMMLDEIRNATILDLNRLITFPCAVTNFVTCPLPPLRNRVPFEITAGEQLPVEHIEQRIQTFHG
ncbi:MAG: DUF1684 domain-containing protein [Bifidobacterium psychraerophilum]|uniref:DUF1684 domain-containing protein n=1 Tax=Bifidobacterium psychraerophilum TaxID=218140 RepID=UPI0039EB3401